MVDLACRDRLPHQLKLYAMPDRSPSLQGRAKA